MVAGLRFLWRATKGHRLRPWRSPYLRWRMETFTGQWAHTIGPRDLCRLVVRERGQMVRFLRWTGEMKGYAEQTRKG
jgi:hypothetical protein